MQSIVKWAAVNHHYGNDDISISNFVIALKTETNVPAMKELLNCAVNTLTDGQYSHIGSESLWNKHSVAASRMIAKLDKYKVKQASPLAVSV